MGQNINKDYSETMKEDENMYEFDDLPYIKKNYPLAIVIITTMLLIFVLMILGIVWGYNKVHDSIQNESVYEISIERDL